METSQQSLALGTFVLLNLKCLIPPLTLEVAKKVSRLIKKFNFVLVYSDAPLGDRIMSIDLLTNQSIFSLFPDEVISSEAIYKSFRIAKPGEVLVQQGESIDFVIIPVSGNLKLSTSNNGIKQEQIGILLAGRSSNLYCFLRSLPSQYSVVAENDIQVLVIPRAEVEKWFTKYPYVKEYLMKITGNLKFRKLVKKLDELGVNKWVLVQFLSYMNEVQHPPFNLIIKKGSIPDAVHYLSEGQCSFESQ
jgi:signal-transduction protein with cAMP-binding, CBS, and nucleotidyltransferase domain